MGRALSGIYTKETLFAFLNKLLVISVNTILTYMEKAFNLNFAA
jgi:hypothetical protein